MICINVNNIQTAQNIANYCNKFTEDVDIFYSKYNGDGKNVASLLSFIGNIITIDIDTKDEAIKENFNNGILMLKK